jgi:hypothetical protein
MSSSRAETEGKPGEAAEAPRSQEPARPDVALVRGVTEDGGGLVVLRCREERVELGSVRPIQEGKPITGEVVRLSPRPEHPLLCDVKTEFSAPGEACSEPTRETMAPAGERKGPAQVATDSYRENWDLIWKRRTADDKLLN